MSIPDIPDWIYKAAASARSNSAALSPVATSIDETAQRAGEVVEGIVAESWGGLGALAAGAAGAEMERSISVLADELREAADRYDGHAEAMDDVTDAIDDAISDHGGASQDATSAEDQLETYREDEDASPWDILKKKGEMEWAELRMMGAEGRVRGAIEDAERWDRLHAVNLDLIESDIADTVSRFSNTSLAITKSDPGKGELLAILTGFAIASEADRASEPIDLSDLIDEAADLAGADPEDVAETLEELKRAGLVDYEDLNSLYVEWVAREGENGLDPSEIIEKAKAEDVDPETFAPLLGLERVEDGFFIVDPDTDIRAASVASELLMGGNPSESEWRRDANAWSYGYGESIIDAGGEVAVTPLGTIMAAKADGDDFPPTGGSGTAWGEMYVLNGTFQDPKDTLRDEIEEIVDTGDEVLEHERNHADQWAILGFKDFIITYGVSHLGSYALKPPWSDNSLGCYNLIEVGADAEMGNYHCDYNARDEILHNTLRVTSPVYAIGSFGWNALFD